MYDIVYVSSTNDDKNFLILKKRYPLIKYSNTIEEAKKKVFTNMFWVIPSDVVVLDTFEFDFRVPKWDEDYVHVFKNNDSYDGIFLVSKNRYISENEYEYRFFTDRKEIDIQASKPRPYDKFYIDSYDEYLDAIKNTTTDIFWVIPSDVVVLDTFEFDFRVPKWDEDYVHVFKNNDSYDGIFLVSKNRYISENEYGYRFFTNKKEIDIQASIPRPYDKFYIDSYDEYLDAIQSTTTDIFWVIPSDVVVLDTFEFDFRVPKWDEDYVHVFKNGDLFNGIFLCSKCSNISKKEYEYRFFTNKKEIEIQASIPRPYDKFYIDSYDEYLEAIQSTTTDMFWVIPSDVVVLDTFEFDFRVPEWDEDYVHVFKNGDLFNGIFLVSKNRYISENEYGYRFFTNKKEIDIQASIPRPYDKFYIDSYDEYLDAIKNTTTDIFWVIPSDVVVLDTFEFDFRVPEWDEDYVHVFKNNDSYDGIFLCSKCSNISKKEYEYRFFTNKKEIDIQASKPRPYDKFYIDSYDEYLDAIQSTTTDMFWVIPSDVVVLDTFEFDFRVPEWDEDYVHVFKNGDSYDGVFLCSKRTTLSRNEYENRFPIKRKDIDILISNPNPYDIVFISYKEKNAEINYSSILSKYNNVHRIDGVKGIHAAHKEAAKIVTSKMFWVIDADAILVDDFNMNYHIPTYELNNMKSVHVWRSINPINGLIYGYGGVKLLPTKLTIEMDITNPDMTTSISKSFIPMDEISNITEFNTDPFSTWRSAFRECVKLSSKIIDGQNNQETDDRLHVWCTTGYEKLFGSYAIEGAIAGKEYGIKNADDLSALSKINDFTWLEEQFNLIYQKSYQ